MTLAALRKLSRLDGMGRSCKGSPAVDEEAPPDEDMAASTDEKLLYTIQQKEIEVDELLLQFLCDQVFTWKRS